MDEQQLENMATYMCALGARSCSLKHLDEGRACTDYGAWNSGLAAPMQAYLTVFGLECNFENRSETDVNQLCSRLVGVDPVRYLEENCAALISGSYGEAWKFLLPEDQPTIRRKYYALAQILYVIQVQQRMMDQDTWTTANLTQPQEPQLKDTLFTACENLDDSIKNQYSKVLGLNNDRVYSLWLRLYGQRCVMPTIRRGQKVDDATKCMQEAGMGEERQMQIYCCAQLYGTILSAGQRKIESPFRYLRRICDAQRDDLASGNKTTSVYLCADPVQEFFDAEAVFDQAANRLKDVQPVQYYLDKGYYGRRREELAYEMVALRTAAANLDDRTLIYEPNPYMVSELLDGAAAGNACPALAFRDCNQASVYLMQYPQAAIAYLDEEAHQLWWAQPIDLKRKVHSPIAVEPKTYDTILAFWRTGGEREVLEATLLNLKSCLADDGAMVCYVPAACANKFHTRKTLCDNYRISKISLLPKYGDSMKGVLKRYVVLELRTGCTEDTVSVPIWRMERAADGDDKYLVPNSHVVKMNAGALRENGQTLARLWQYAYRKGTTEQKRITRRYAYALEIKMSYSWSKGRGRHYYSACPTAKQKRNNPYQRGDRLSDIVEFSAPTEAAAAEVVAKAVREPDMQTLVAKDVLRAYRNEGLSYRAYYYCVALNLKGKPRYNQEAAERLFSAEQIAAMKTSEVYTLDDYMEAMRPILEQEPDQRNQQQLWEQLNVLLEDAVQKNWVEKNPVRAHVAAMRDTDERYRQVRAASMKKSLTHEEEVKMLAAAKESLPQDGLLLGAAIQMYTGMQAAEIRALRWEDVRKMEHVECASLRVSKRFEGTANKMEVVPLEGTKLRWVPCTPSLYDLLKQRRKWLEEQGWKNEMMKALPIVPGDSSDLTKPATRDQFYLATRRFVEGAGIQECDIYLPSAAEKKRETDINVYHGVLLRSNYVYKCEQVCGMEGGETAYILGNTPQDTFSAHYCDYGNQNAQIMLARKLARWDCQHRTTKDTVQLDTSKNSGDAETLLLRGKEYSGPVVTELDVTIEGGEEEAEMREIKILDQGGADIVVLGREGGY